jgi:hypothetical protein
MIEILFYIIVIIILSLIVVYLGAIHKTIQDIRLDNSKEYGEFIINFDYLSNENIKSESIIVILENKPGGDSRDIFIKALNKHLKSKDSHHNIYTFSNPKINSITKIRDIDFYCGNTDVINFD